jgi:hypothetical protein
MWRIGLQCTQGGGGRLEGLVCAIIIEALEERQNTGYTQGIGW